MTASDEFAGTHVRTWLFRRSWASALESADQEYVRVAALVESEFALRWVALDARATWALCSDACPTPLADLLVASIRDAPSIADKGATKKPAQAADQALVALAPSGEVEAFIHAFRTAGQGRSREYERVLSRRFGAYSHGFAVMGSLKPDVIFEEYSPCAVTAAGTSEPKAIEKAIQRRCHVAEFTAHLQADLRGLGEYLCEKVRVYAALLETV
jgi:hypothetical protein